MMIEFEPLLTFNWLLTILALLLLVSLAMLVMRLRGAALRLLAALALALALLNPIFIYEEREPVKSVVAVIVDESQSQDLRQRRDDSEAALKSVEAALSALPQFEPRIVRTGRPTAANGSLSTRLFDPMAQALSDVSPSRIAGAILITDGQVHDIPANRNAIGFNAPIHALVTGQPDEFDRRIRFVNAPRFGISEKPLEMSFIVEDEGRNLGATAEVDVLVNGEVQTQLPVPVGRETSFEINLPRAGVNIVELATPVRDGELTDWNNRAVATIDGVRDHLRVLLVSGEPHNGERAWRDLLKSDTGVDLVHFTILRPPEKSDGTPMDELALIAFPMRELFVDKISQFDLVILDRYQHMQLMPSLYYDYIAQYVENGGALLIAAGPEYASENSIAQTPLFNVLPALPNGKVIEEPFFPRLTDLGKKHPVTRGLEGSDQEPPKWSRWFRTIEVEQPRGETVMSGAQNKPLLILSHVGQGRVATFLSDQGWLWARGFEGGGPYVALYRRIAHWLMKEPQLEEEALTAGSEGRMLTIRQQTMADQAAPVTVKTPSGREIKPELKQTAPGLFEAEVPTEEIGIFHIRTDERETLAHVGPIDALEFADSISTTEKLEPLLHSTGGSSRRLHESSNDAVNTPAIVAVESGRGASGSNWIGLRVSDDSQLKSVDRIPLFTGLLALAVLLLAIASAWAREGR